MGQCKQQQGLFDLLRNVSIRLPLLIFGTATDFDESIRLAEFVDKVDAASWQEFMPKEVGKDLFLKLLVFYDEDVIEGAGMRIRRMAKAADELMPTRRVMKIAEIFSYFRNPAKETVLTPWRVVNMHMGDTIGGYNFYQEGYPVQDGLLEEPRLIEQGEVTSDLFLNEDVRILEMNSKSGLYPLYVAYSIYRMMLPKDEERMTLEEAQVWWRRALENHLFVLCQTTMAVAITRRTLAGYTGAEVNAVYIPRLLDRMADKPRLARKLTNPETWKKEGERMKFDAIVGNPPYQQETGNTSRQATPVYNIFVEQAMALDPHYISMITPSRWFAGGMGLDSFRERMMHCSAISMIFDYINGKDCFPQISISGGVSYFLYDKNNKNDCRFTSIMNRQTDVEIRKLDEFPVLVRYNKAVDIIRKVSALHEKGIDTIISSLMPFGLSTNIRGTDFPTSDDYLILHSSEGQGYIDADKVTKGMEYIDKYKVLMSKTSAEHAGEPGKDGKFKVFPSSMKVIGPREICTHSYFLVGSFGSEHEAVNTMIYLKTRFVRFLVLISLSAINLSKLVFNFVPLQDFSKPWTDAELYAKYGLTDEEIAFVEATIKPME